ncbi:monodechloroaminopyrrolnitrin synthase PrnB family protein [Streptomyces sp.]|uniref:monodechloroaminopyrrolnitrin synthase PrnB family protein n=1 Tax=Streptomyces sp. TaxID=1931 RepID=UPI002D68CB57|nr:monodechloroaminopyrrolnitrin synthase PrnB family protein [Streptomyces sp.]HZF90981.1 monodechloroaminopyrrolnitrin synthase PrnB family protein [Streptomyces sp.]
MTSEEHNEKVGQLDPLELDVDLRALPKMNESGDVAALARVLREALPPVERVAAFTLPECLAAMRDLGMYLGSLKRHGVSAFDIVPEATETFQLLGRRTRMIPRDTVYHYTCWNPVGERERLYSGQPMERRLIHAVRTCVPELANAVRAGCSLQYTDLRTPDGAAAMWSLASHVTAADKAMSSVLAEVTPEFFALVLRPFFEDVRIAGRIYMGPAAAHIPLFLIDLLLWASDRGSRDYLTFCDEVASHTLPDWRERHAEWTQTPSMTSRVVAALADSRAPSQEYAWSSARGLRQALRSLTSFRGKHLVMARRAYRAEVRLYELGSGGGSVELLEEILTLTRKNGAMVGGR